MHGQVENINVSVRMTLRIGTRDFSCITDREEHGRQSSVADLEVPTVETASQSNSSPPSVVTEFQTDAAAAATEDAVDSARSSPSIDTTTVDSTVSAEDPSSQDQPSAAPNVEEKHRILQTPVTIL